MSGGFGLCVPWDRHVIPSIAPATAQERRHEWRPDALLLGHLQSWFRLQAERRGYGVEWATVYWQAYCYEMRLNAVIRKDGRWLSLEAMTYGNTSEESWGSASHEAYRRYTRLLDDADRYLAAGNCRAMLKGRYPGVGDL